MNSTDSLVSGPTAARGSGPFLLGVILLLSSCGAGERVEVTEHRDVTRSYGRAQVGATSADRFGQEQAPPPSDHQHTTQAPTAAPSEGPLAWDVPQGWLSLEPTSLRLANLQPAGNPEAECTLTLLGGDGGGDLPNVNRWRSQMGLGPIDQAELDAIPTLTVLGEEAPFFQLDGAYSGMGTEAKPNWSMLGLILSQPNFTIYVKMNGPKELVDAERQNFVAFCASIRPSAPAQAPAEHSHDSKGFVMPEGWRMGPEKSMRNLNLLVGESSECYLTLLGGEAGGLEANLNRWRNEVGMPPMSAEEIAALPTTELFGVQAPMVELTGDYQGMGGPTGADKMVLAVALVRPEGSAFVKMIGPAEEVAAEKENFLKLVASLEE